MGQTNNDCRFRIFILTSSLHQQPLLAGREGSRPRYVLVHNFLRKRCNGSMKWSWLIQWTIWDLRHLLVVFQCQILKYFDARIASALNKIIHNSHFNRRISLEEQKAQKEDRFLRGRQIAYLIYEQFRVTGTHDSVENYTDLFTIVLRNDDIQEFDSKWDGILLSMTKIPHDDILEGLYKLRIRESEKLKTVLELYDLETHQKKLGPDYHRLKAMVKRSIEQEIRNKNFWGQNKSCFSSFLFFALFFSCSHFLYLPLSMFWEIPVCMLISHVFLYLSFRKKKFVFKRNMTHFLKLSLFFNQFSHVSSENRKNMCSFDKPFLKKVFFW